MTVKLPAANVAVSASPVVIPSSVQGFVVPEQLPPLHPVKVQPADGFAVILTPESPVVTWHVVAPGPHGFVVSATTTDPFPTTLAETVNVFAANVATSASPVMIPSSVQGFVVPGQLPPLQPVNVQPGDGVSVIVTPESPVVTWHVVAPGPHGFVASATTTVPLPTTLAETVNVSNGCSDSSGASQAAREPPAPP